MAAAIGDSRGSAGKKRQSSLKRKKKVKAVTEAVAAERGGSVERKMVPVSSDEEAIEADNEEELEPQDANACDNVAESTAGANVGWADAMAKILNKKTTSKAPILVKNKELEKEKEKFRQERLERRAQLDKKREWEMMCRVKPDVVTDKEAERNLQRIATRGVVQLFNAVQKHQKNVDEKVKEAGGSIRKRAKLISTVSKKDFINVLRGMDGSSQEKSGKKLKDERGTENSEEGPSWKILRDDFMMGAAMKDWDRESDGPASASDS